MSAVNSRLDDAVKYLSERNYQQAHQCCVEVIKQAGPHPHA
ncbi:hypothetical protein [Alteromonas sp. KUL42]|nr:hypothetical protein [Alteromonas sp. KUL42]